MAEGRSGHSVSDDPDRAGAGIVGGLGRRVDDELADIGSGSDLPAGHPPPSPASLDGIGVAHAIDGDGTALCQPHLRLEQVDDYFWDAVPAGQRCPVCAAVIDRP